MFGVEAASDVLFIARKNFIGDSNNRIASSISKLTYSPVDDQLDLSSSAVVSQTEDSLFTERRFLTSFKSGDYVYYIYDLEGQAENGNNLRISRTCISDNGVESGGSVSLATFTEAILQCSGVTSESVSSSTTVTINGHMMVLVNHFITDTGTNEICQYNVTMINEAMDSQLEMCANGVGVRGLDREGSTQACPKGLSETVKQVCIIVSLHL